MAGLDPRLSGSILVDKVHGIDSSVLQAFGDVLGHERRIKPCCITIAYSTAC